jgi:hypothetical protein
MTTFYDLKPRFRNLLRHWIAGASWSISGGETH